jgi:hypothetical protein
MARPRAIKDEKVFAIADRLADKGIEPSIVRVAEIAKRRYGATPSYTTLKSVLSNWSSQPNRAKTKHGGADSQSSKSDELRELHDLVKQAACSLNQLRDELTQSRHEILRRISKLESRVGRPSAESVLSPSHGRHKS